MATNSIGPYTFVAFDGMPQTIHQQLEIIQRPGVDGTGLMLQGIRGRPFTLRTGVDGVGRVFAFQAFANYAALVGGNPVNIIHGGVSLGNINALFAILEVRLLGVESLALKIGGTTAGSNIWLTAEWDMIAIHTANT